MNWLLLSEQCLDLRREEKDKRQRLLMSCLLCRKYEGQVIKFTSNEQLPISAGIHVDGKDRKCYRSS